LKHLVMSSWLGEDNTIVWTLHGSGGLTWELAREVYLEGDFRKASNTGSWPWQPTILSIGVVVHVTWPRCRGRRRCI
jgi:hypothetical protein